MNYVVQRAFRDTKKPVHDSTIFVNFFENAVFLVAQLVDQFKRQVDQSM